MAKPAVGPWASVLLAAPMALLVVAGVEASRVPADVLFGDPTRPLRLLVLGLRASFAVLWAPLLFQVVASAVAALPAHRLDPRLRVALCAIPAVAITVWCWAAVAEYPPFRTYVPFFGLFALLLAYLALWTSRLGRPARPAEAGLLRRLARFALPSLGLGGFAVVSALNRRVLEEAYPALHESALQVSLLLLHAGLVATWALASRSSRAWRAWTWTGVFSSVLVVALVLTGVRWCDEDRPTFRRHTDLGRAEARRWPPPEGEAADRKRPSRTRVNDPLAIERFAAVSNLPELPAGFRLQDYNLLFVTLDAVRYRDTDLRRSGWGITPNLARFAKGGSFWFSRAYASGPSTIQSMASIFTSTYPSLARLRLRTTWHGRLGARAITAAELFRRVGYRTFYAGHNYKGHFSARGRIRGLHQGFAELRFAAWTRDGHAEPGTDTEVLSLARDALERHRGLPERFFGWVFFESPHPPFLARYDDMRGRTSRQRYRQEIRFADERLGDLLDYLRSAGLLDSTVVVVFGDHGTAFGEHRKFGHGDVYSEVTHVPLVIHIPGQRGRRIDPPTSLMYLFPWLFLRGPEPLRAFAERRLRHHIGPMLRRTDGAVVTEMLCRRCARTSLVYPNRRLVYDFSSKYVELYDLRKDPGERRNLAPPGTPLPRLFRRRLDGYLLVRRALGAPPP